LVIQDHEGFLIKKLQQGLFETIAADPAVGGGRRCAAQGQGQFGTGILNALIKSSTFWCQEIMIRHNQGVMWGTISWAEKLARCATVNCSLLRGLDFIRTPNLRPWPPVLVIADRAPFLPFCLDSPQGTPGDPETDLSSD